MENTKAVMKPASITIKKNGIKKVRKLNVKVLVRAITIPVIILIIWQL
ncbi:ABC transporter permease, partial [Bacillus cereus]